MKEKSFNLTLTLSLDDASSICAACGAMAIGLMKECSDVADLAEATHLQLLHLRIQKAMVEAVKTCEMNDNES